MLLRRSPKSKFIQHTDKGTDHATSARRSCSGQLSVSQLTRVYSGLWRLKELSLTSVVHDEGYNLVPESVKSWKLNREIKKILILTDDMWLCSAWRCLDITCVLSLASYFLCVKSVSNHKRRLWRMGVLVCVCVCVCGGGGGGFFLLPCFPYRVSVRVCTLAYFVWINDAAEHPSLYSGTVV